MSTVDLAELAALPARLARVEAELAEVRDRLTVAERHALSIAEAAEALGVSTKTVWRRVRAGQIQHRRTGRRVAVYLP